MLDTHTLLWFFGGSDKLPETVASVIENSNAKKIVSVASLWEFCIKCSLGKLRFEGGFPAFCKMLDENGLDVFPISRACLEELIHLPFVHRDPFDRLLVATALAENMTLLTVDENIRRYDVRWKW